MILALDAGVSYETSRMRPAAFLVGYEVVVISLWNEGAAAPARPRLALMDL
jgi:hypothetical protein